MGIPAYFSYIVKNHPTVIKKIEHFKPKINNLYMDCNSIIYDVIHSTEFLKSDKSNDYIIQTVIAKIDAYISVIRPNNNIFIAFDGVAPVAKLEQQRQRRYKSAYQNKVKYNIFKKSGIVQPEEWNTSAITPGTIFMKNLNHSMKKYYNNPAQFNVDNLILSTSDEHGEGEHKIFAYIRDTPEFHADKTTIIYGLDADLIMLCINHLHINKNIYLYRETPYFIKTVESSLEPNYTYLLDIPEFAQVISKNMKFGNNTLYDYIFICFFLGNDFMPHFPSLNIRTGGIDKLLNAYKETITSPSQYLTDGTSIVWKNVRLLVSFLAEQEDNHIKRELVLRDKREKNYWCDNNPDNVYKHFELVPSYDRSLEKQLNPNIRSWQHRYYKLLFKIEPDEARIKQICINYLEGLEWTMRYYTSGCCDWRWCYNYDYPPLLKDLIKYIPYFETSFVSCKPPSPVTDVVQLCYVLPKQSLHLIPYHIYKPLIKHKSDQYPDDCEFSWAFCKYFWECHADLPYIEINEIEQFVDNCQLNI